MKLPHKSLRVHSARSTYAYRAYITQLHMYKLTTSTAGNWISDKLRSDPIIKINLKTNKQIKEITGISSRKVRKTGRNRTGVTATSRMTSHCNGNTDYSKTALPLSLSVSLTLPSPPSSPPPPSQQFFGHNCVTASRCTRNVLLKELSEWHDLTVRGRLFHRKAPDKPVLVLNMSTLGLGKLRW